MKYIWDKQVGAWVPRDEYCAPARSGVQIVRDIDPYVSTITGERITSRSHHRDHLRAHRCIEVGNEFAQSKPNFAVPGLRTDILRSMGRG